MSKDGDEPHVEVTGMDKLVNAVQNDDHDRFKHLLENELVLTTLKSSIVADNMEALTDPKRYFKTLADYGDEAFMENASTARALAKNDEAFVWWVNNYVQSVPNPTVRLGFRAFLNHHRDNEAQVPAKLFLSLAPFKKRGVVVGSLANHLRKSTPTALKSVTIIHNKLDRLEKANAKQLIEGAIVNPGARRTHHLVDSETVNRLLELCPDLPRSLVHKACQRAGLSDAKQTRHAL